MRCHCLATLSEVLLILLSLHQCVTGCVEGLGVEVACERKVLRFSLQLFWDFSLAWNNARFRHTTFYTAVSILIYQIDLISILPTIPFTVMVNLVALFYSASLSECLSDLYIICIRLSVGRSLSQSVVYLWDWSIGRSFRWAKFPVCLSVYLSACLHDILIK